MPKNYRHGSKTAGLMPGTLVYTGEKKDTKVKITLIDYDEEKFQEKELTAIEECFVCKDTPTVTWVNVDGIHDTSIIEKIGGCFELHPLTLEDIVNIEQRPKCEDFENYVFIVVKMLMFDEEKKEITSEQVSLILGEHFVISVQENEGDVFNLIRERLRSNKGMIRKQGPDYLVYSLLDAIVDYYFVILEHLGEKIELIEENLIADPIPARLRVIHAIKRDAIFLRKSVWPLREVVNRLVDGESKLIKKTSHIFFCDVYDHTIQVIDTIESFRDTITGMFDIYLSSVSNRMNEIMKVLTIIATIFIPITFVAGIYGMNFNTGASPFNMPELNWRFGYMFAWAIMIGIVVIMVIYFKRKRWI